MGRLWQQRVYEQLKRAKPETAAPRAKPQKGSSRYPAADAKLPDNISEQSVAALRKMVEQSGSEVGRGLERGELVQLAEQRRRAWEAVRVLMCARQREWPRNQQQQAALRVGRSASRRDVQLAYRRMALLLHTDKVPADYPARDRKRCEEAFRFVVQAKDDLLRVAR
ncbi:unnamed protein product [Pedinophyceae sp. YPF-701]|nr:unnamed protein product [Pedinophyceae sp. YPF-701]